MIFKQDFDILNRRIYVQPDIILAKVTEAIWKIPRNKAPGCNGIPNELIKYVKEAVSQTL